MVVDTDIAWLAGLLDGEGCISLRRVRGKKMVLARIELGMADFAGVRAAAEILESIAGANTVNLSVREKKSPLTKRRQLFLYVCAKRSVLSVLKAIVPYLRVKELEAKLAVNFLERACSEFRYRATDDDYLLCDLSARLKRGCGEARVEASELLGQVIPSQAVVAFRVGSEGSAEGVEIRDLSANNNGPHERPAAILH